MRNNVQPIPRYPSRSRLWRDSLSCAFLILLLACGGGSSPVTEVARPYVEKVTILQVTDSSVSFSVEVDEGRFELFSVNPINGNRTGISDVFSANNGLRPVAISPDGNRIAYRADRDNNGSDELYSNLMDGSNEILLTNSIATATTSNAGVQTHYNWQWLADSSGVIFRSDVDSDGIVEIQTINVDGTNRLEISADLATRCDLADCWKMANDGSYITFLVEVTSPTNEINQSLYSVAPDGSGLVMLNTPLNADSRIQDWQWSPDDSLLAFISQNSGEPAELWVASGDAATQTLISANGLSTGVSRFAWAPDASRLAFSEDAGSANNPSLYNILPDATGRVQLIDTFQVANPQVIDWQWAPNGSRLAYRADQETAGLVELFTVESDGQWHRRMNPPMLAGDTVYSRWQWSPDSSHVAFLGEIESTKLLDELYSAAADGSQTLRVNLDLAAEGQLQMVEPFWNGDGSHLLYQVTNGNNIVEGLYSVTADGTESHRLNETLLANESLSGSYHLSFNNRQILYQQTNSRADVSLHIADLDGTNRVNLATVGLVSQPHWLLDDSRIIYVFQPDTSQSQQLLSILPDGTGKIQLY